jgi:hypothetical protein
LEQAQQSGRALKRLLAPQQLSLNTASDTASAQMAGPTLTPLTNQLPDGIKFTMLLTDGTVMAQDGIYPYMWWKLTPDINGSYLNGTWTQLANLPQSYPISELIRVPSDAHYFKLEQIVRERPE